MASQPANVLIKVRRTVRSRTALPLNRSIKEHCQRLTAQEVMVPGEEIDVYLTVDSAGANAPGPNPAWRYGMPVSVNKRTRYTPAQTIAAVAADPTLNALDFPLQIVGSRQDRFLWSTEANARDDLFADIVSVSPAPRGLIKIV